MNWDESYALAAVGEKWRQIFTPPELIHQRRGILPLQTPVTPPISSFKFPSLARAFLPPNHNN